MAAEDAYQLLPDEDEITPPVVHTYVIDDVEIQRAITRELHRIKRVIESCDKPCHISHLCADTNQSRRVNNFDIEFVNNTTPCHCCVCCSLHNGTADISWWKRALWSIGCVLGCGACRCCVLNPMDREGRWFASGQSALVVDLAHLPPGQKSYDAFYTRLQDAVIAIEKGYYAGCTVMIDHNHYTNGFRERTEMHVSFILQQPPLTNETV